MQVECIAYCSPWSILQYFRPALSECPSRKPTFWSSWFPVYKYIESSLLRMVTLLIGKKPSLIRAYTSEQFHKSLCCSRTQSIKVDERLDQQFGM